MGYMEKSSLVHVEVDESNVVCRKMYVGNDLVRIMMWQNGKMKK